MSKQAIPVQHEGPKTLLVGVYTPFNHVETQEYYFDEFLNLIKTLEIKYQDSYFTKLRLVDNNMFFTKGKLEELQKICEEKQPELIIFSDLLSPVQERNLENALSCEIMDRERLILEIFKKSAHSSEGKIQVEMAEIEYYKTRLIGKGRELSQQAGLIGTRGPGETAKEEMRRKLSEKIRQAQKRVDTLVRSREIQRKKRISSSTKMICIIGYTNAGKSSLLNRIAKCDVPAENRLFATLDTTTRELFIDSKKIALISDTVGFISQLPHSLIDAFKSTLDELRYSNLLLQVIDSSNPAWKSQIRIVQEILDELEIKKPMIYVFNKIDLLTQEQKEELYHECERYAPQVFIHTKSKEGVGVLIDFLSKYKF
jgi:GTP-binding protein HflX